MVPICINFRKITYAIVNRGKINNQLNEFYEKNEIYIRDSQP